MEMEMIGTDNEIGRGLPETGPQIVVHVWKFLHPHSLATPIILASP